MSEPTIELGDELRAQLVTLRLLWEADDEPVLGRADVAAVEAELDCALHPSLLALLAARLDELDDEDVDLKEIVGHTRAARARGCGPKLIAVGRQPDGHAYYCVERRPDPGAPLRWYDFDQLDGSISSQTLTRWLEDRIEARREFLEDDEPELSEREPGEAELAAFVPRLT